MLTDIYSSCNTCDFTRKPGQRSWKLKTLCYQQPNKCASYGTWAHSLTMLMAVATRPAATRLAFLARRSPTRSRHRYIIDLSVKYAAKQHRPTADHDHVFQCAATPPHKKVPPSLDQSSPKGGKICYPQVYHPAKFHRAALTHTGDSAYKKSCGHTQTLTVNDISLHSLSVLQG